MSQSVDIIFRSKLILYYKNPQLECDYCEFTTQSTRISNKILMTILLLLSSGMAISLIVCKVLHHQSCCIIFNQYIVLIILIGIISVMDIPILCLAFMHSKSPKTQKKIAYYSFFNIKIHMTILKILLEGIFKQNFHNFYFLSILDYILRSSLYFFGAVDFTPSFIINMLLFAIILGIYYGIPTINALTFDNGISFIILEVGSILSSYCIVYYKKVTFFYLTYLHEREKEGMKIINSLNTGYLKISKGKIEIINHSLQNLIAKARKTKGIIPSNMTDIDFTSHIHQDIILNFFFADYCNKYRDKAQNSKAKTKDEDMSSLNVNSAEILQILLMRYNQSTLNNKDPKFIFLTYESFDLDNGNQTTYEILLKFQLEEFKFIFNDVTRTKQFEKKECDLKIQNVFLTKVAHEFKNPLVCIDEIVNQIKEIALLSNMPDHTSTQLINKCSVIKSFNEYLLLLINDLDYFTLELNELTQPATSSHFQEEKVNIRELVAYCLEMSEIKLKNMNKSKEVRIETNISDDIPRDIQSNYKKLKHLLIKLLNNAIKYTTKGIITFSIDKRLGDNKDELIFIIQDTGKGISDHLISQFDNKNILNEDAFKNKHIGLFIIKQLANQLGKGKDIQMISKEGIGTTFWFTIPIQDSDNSEEVNHSRDDKYSNTKADNDHLITNRNKNSGYQIKKDKANGDKLNESILTLQHNILLSLPRNENAETNDKDTSLEIVKQKELTILFVDDEELARKALLRIIKEVARKKNIKVNAIEGRDGSETLFKIYQHNYSPENRNINDNIDAVISDQKMTFINGSNTIKILTTSSNLLPELPFFIVTAFDPNAVYFNNIKCNGIYSKPLRNNDADKILESLVSLV